MNSCARYLLFALVLVVLRGFGQTALAQQPAAQTPPAQSAPAKVEMPSDPAALLELAAKKNGLQNAGSEPLHIKATYQLFDDKGGVKETGTIDEIRVSDKKYKLTYASPSFSQTDYSTDAGLFRVGDQNWPSDPLFAAFNSLYPLLRSKGAIDKVKLGTETKTLGTTTLNCVTTVDPRGSFFDYDRLYCLSPNAPVLRLVETFHGASQSMYNSVASVGGVYVAQDATYLEVGKQLVRIHLNSINAVPKLDEGIFAHPASAMKIPRRITALPATVLPKLLYAFPAELPDTTMADRLQGDVIVQAVIGTDGKVVSARILSGPPILKQAALGAIRRWIFEPVSLNGEPVELSIEFDNNIRRPERTHF
jgi:TonB family protein